MIHTKNLRELQLKYMQRSIETSKIKTKKWTPMLWLEYKDAVLKKRELLYDNWIDRAIRLVFPDCMNLLPDYKYWTANVQDYNAFLELDDTDKFEYTPEFYDCDDFAWRLMGKLHHPLYGAFAHGVAWSDVHAFNCFVDWKQEFYIIEPQNDQIVLAGVLAAQDDSYLPELVIF